MAITGTFIRPLSYSGNFAFYWRPQMDNATRTQRDKLKTRRERIMDQMEELLSDYEDLIDEAYEKGYEDGQQDYADEL
jgi:ribosome-binding protein aMBF1 (putative translation factor)